jgi:hypothetical protein
VSVGSSGSVRKLSSSGSFPFWLVGDADAAVFGDLRFDVFADADVGLRFPCTPTHNQNEKVREIARKIESQRAKRRE